MNYVDQELDIINDPCVGKSIKALCIDGKTYHLKIGDDKKIYISRVTRRNPNYDPKLASEHSISLTDILQGKSRKDKKTI